MREAEHHHHVLAAGVGDGVPTPGGHEQALAGGERHLLASRRNSPEPLTTYATSSVSCATMAVTHPGREHRVAERGAVPPSEEALRTILDQLPAGRADRVDVLELYGLDGLPAHSTHWPSLMIS